MAKWTAADQKRYEEVLKLIKGHPRKTKMCFALLQDQAREKTWDSPGDDKNWFYPIRLDVFRKYVEEAGYNLYVRTEGSRGNKRLDLTITEKVKYPVESKHLRVPPDGETLVEVK